MLSVLMGLITIILGYSSYSLWVGGFWGIVNATVSTCFICGGLIALLAGLSSLSK